MKIDLETGPPRCARKAAAMRTVHSPAPSLSGNAGPPQTVLADLRLEVVIPMFGGGVTPGTIDANQPIRPAAIRGQLRFWWRACNAGAFASLVQLHECERLLWGSATRQDAHDPSVEATWGPGLIGIQVLEVQRATRVFSQRSNRQANGRYRWNWRIGSDQNNRDVGVNQYVLDYALFPFKAEEKRDPATNRYEVTKEPDNGEFDVGFRLQLRLGAHAGRDRKDDPTKQYPDVAAVRHAVMQALWAWITFGGVGARTRRGCGALHCIGDASVPSESEIRVRASDLIPSEEDLGQWFMPRWTTIQAEPLVSAGTPLIGVPALRGCRIATGPVANSAFSAWEAAIAAMKDFTQGPGIARFPGPKESWWPEVSAAREVLGRPDLPHKIADEGAADRPNFPRADLGLPRLIKVTANDRHGTPLQGPDGKARLASPIILKVLPVSNGFVPIALMLHAPHVWDAGTPGVMMDTREVTVGPLSTIAASDWPFAMPSRPPFVTTPGAPDSARDAFMNYLKAPTSGTHPSKGRGWTEVIL